MSETFFALAGHWSCLSSTIVPRCVHENSLLVDLHMRRSRTKHKWITASLRLCPSALRILHGVRYRAIYRSFQILVATNAQARLTPLGDICPIGLSLILARGRSRRSGPLAERWLLLHGSGLRRGPRPYQLHFLEGAKACQTWQRMDTILSFFKLPARDRAGN